jgi:hypothetical protein
MKRYIIYSLGVLLTASVTFMTSCQKDFGDVNVNPNQPSDVPVNLLLPSAEASLAYTLGGDIARYNAVFTQNVTGADRQFAAYNAYVFNEDDFNNLWNNMYADNMNDLNTIIQKGKDADGSYNAYRGIARILMAYSLSMMTDLYGDVPFREAFQGNNKLNPAYDSQEDIYQVILPQLIADGLADLDNTGDDILTPGSDDFIYGGDLDLWKKFGHGLNARILIHQSKKSTFNAQAVIDEVNASFSSFSEDAAFTFGTAYQSPWFQYIDQRADISYSTLDYYYGIGCFHTDTMQAMNDPRFSKMIDVNGDYYAPGFPSAFYMADNAPVTLLSYHEVLFIKAEAELRNSDPTAAGQSLSMAVDANMDKLGVDPVDRDAYKAANVDFPNASDQLGMIMFQKYIANYLQPESFNDWRRTGYPDLQPNSGAATGIPRRYIYPTNERQNNPNAVNSNSSLFTPRLWWDQ